MITAYSYVRFSSLKQTNSDSLRRQTERTEAACAEHGWELDTTLSLQDLGVSAWKGKNATTGALAMFMEAARKGKVGKGNVLVVESLDRLSRQSVPDALELFLGILKTGVDIYTLSTNDHFSRKNVGDIARLLTAIIYLSRANEESEIKSQRLKAKWVERRKTIGQGQPTRAGKIPAWLAWDDGKFKVLADKARAVKLVFKLATEGHSLLGIVQHLHQREIPTLSGNGSWHASTVKNLLSNRTVLGEFQPHEGDGKQRRKPVGKPLANYYPRIIADDVWYRCQQARNVRLQVPKSTRVRNLFSGIMFHADDGSLITTVHKHTLALISSTSLRGVKGAPPFCCFPYHDFEEAALFILQELKAEDLTDEAPQDDNLPVLQGQLVELEARLDALKEALKTGSNLATVIQAIAELEGEKTALEREIESEKARSTTDTHKGLSDTHSIIDLLANNPDDVDLRVRLQQRIRQLIERIEIRPIPPEGTLPRQCEVLVKFYAGGYRAWQINASCKRPYRPLGVVDGGKTLEARYFYEVDANNVTWLEQPRKE